MVKPDDENNKGYAYLPEPPITEQKSEEELKYARRIQEAIDCVTGKEVASSLGGDRGYILKTADGHYIACYLEEDRLELLSGAGEPTPAELQRIGVPALSSRDISCSDSELIKDNRYCISTELQRFHRLIINGAAIGDRSFNICFPEGIELENMVVENWEGVRNLRVFWEQW